MVFRRTLAAAALLGGAGVSASTSYEMRTYTDLAQKEGEKQEETLGQHLREFSELVVGVMDNFAAMPMEVKGNATVVTDTVTEKPAEQKEIKPVAVPVATKAVTKAVEAAKAAKPVSVAKPADKKAAAAPAAPAVTKAAATKAPVASDKDIQKVRADVKKIELKIQKDRKHSKHPSHFEFPPELQKLNEQFKKPISHMFGGSGPDAKLQQLTIMVPMLEGMYDKFKEDIKANNRLEKNSAARLKQYTDELAEIQKTGKNKYLLEEKERAYKYFKKQREIQHRHYHAMLKMAHASMERLNKVKKMVAKAEKTGSVEKSDMEALGAMLPGGLTVF